jgi:hypothetical protein
MVIIIVLKLDSGVNPGQDPSHESGGSTWVDRGQCMNKSCYYHNFKTWLGGWLRQDLGHRSTQVDPSQCTNKNDYYHSFKTWLEIWPEIKFRLYVGRVNSADSIFF